MTDNVLQLCQTRFLLIRLHPGINFRTLSPRIAACCSCIFFIPLFFCFPSDKDLLAVKYNHKNGKRILFPFLFPRWFLEEIQANKYPNSMLRSPTLTYKENKNHK